jgi:hypothetical protein
MAFFTWIWPLTIFVAIVFLMLNAIAYWLWHKGYLWHFISFALFCIANFGAAILLFEVYSEIYPLESFYKEEFVKVTGQDFPRSGRFLFKSASYPSIQGDYESCALIEVSMDDFSRLRSNMPEHHRAPSPIDTECMINLTQVLGKVSILNEHFTGNATRQNEDTYWALIAEKPQVLIHYVTW